MSTELEVAKDAVLAWKSKYPYASDDFPLDAFLLVLKEPPEQKTPKAKAPEKRVKRNDPETSFAAAVSAFTDPTLYGAIYGELRYRMSHFNAGLTDEQLVPRVQSKLTATPSGVRSRRAELVEAGWVKDSGKRGVTRAGKPCIIWVALPDYR